MILASKSPRRKEILQQMGFNLEIKVKEIEEISDKEELTEQIMDISKKKVMEVANENRDSFVVGADTVVEIDGKVLGKPKDEIEAKNMLKLLSGRGHRVVTALTLVNKEKNISISDYVKSEVFFREITEEEIDWYISTKEPMDKAGSYGIQGLGAVFVERIDGDFFSIMGFPINKFMNILKNIGFTVSDIKNI
ncbi:nucleoside triphosphate pyrophosphatase [uncultured Cetobacterium sp.]|uniref:Maf family protein n=1 Tax=uncultured Cetobacterium sp. TaxID=527638 RepID=UPI00262FB0BF|nr:Maf family protein [uncultured Cetobacterium sp.]